MKQYLALLAVIPQIIFFSNNVLANESSIKVAGVESALVSGAVIGDRTCSDGTFDWFRGNCGQNKVGGLSESAAQGYIKIIETELAKAGYSLLGQKSNSLFFSDVQQSSSTNESAKYIIGVTIIDAKIDSIQSTKFPSGTLSWKTKGKITTKWEILDSMSQEIVYSKEITSDPEIKVSGENVGEVVKQGIKRSTQIILKDKEFKDLFSRL